MTEQPHVMGVLMGDITHNPDAHTKYGLLFEAVARRFPLVEVYDASLRGLHRLINTATTFHLDRQRWREHFYKNASAFRTRSRQVGDVVLRRADRINVTIQIGTMFDTRYSQSHIPNVIYTDYTAHLTGQKTKTSWSPFGQREHSEWFNHERDACRHAAHVLTRSDLVRGSIIEAYGVAPERVTTIGGGVNFAMLPAVPERGMSDRLTVLFIGKDFYRKGGDILLRAFAAIRAELPEARLICVTAGPIGTALPLEAVEIIKMGWDRDRIADLYRTADLFVLPSRLETWGDVLLEAMAFGLPCIGTSGDAMAEIIAHESTGLIVAPEDVEGLAQALRTLLQRPDIRQTWGVVGRQRVETHFTWERVVDHLEPVIHRAAQKVPHGSFIHKHLQGR